MANNKISNREKSVKKGTKINTIQKPVLFKLNITLSLVFYIIWILIGIFMLVFIYGNIRQGFLTQLFGPTREQVQQQNPAVPTQTNLPGVGTVNIECVQNSLTPDAIQKLISDGQAALTEEENAAFKSCIVEPELTEDPGN